MGHPEIKRALFRALALSVAALGLASCVASEKPLLADATPTLGNQFTVQLFKKFSGNRAHELQTSTFRWQHGSYVNVGGAATGFGQFVSRPLQAEELIIQGSNAGGKLFTYWIGRKLAEGTYLIIPLDEENVDATVRNTLCAKRQPEDFCIIDTSEKLVALAKATAISPIKNAELAVIIENEMKGSTSQHVEKVKDDLPVSRGSAEAQTR